MTNVEIVGLVITLIGVGCFSVIFTILYRSSTLSEIADIKSGKKDIELIDYAIYNNLSHVKVRNKTIRTIKSIVFYGLMAFIIPFVIFSIVNNIQGKITMIGNNGVLVVASGSMSVKHKENEYLVANNLNNQFDKFDLIVIQKVDNAESLRLYDVIAFKNDEGVTIIHRIVGMNCNSEGKIEFTTRGDANGRDAIDKFHPTIDDIQGRYVNKRIPLIGMFVLFLQSSLGMVTIIALVYCLLMVDRYTNKVWNEEEARLDKLRKAIDFENENEKLNLKAQYVETIYYKGYAYLFNEEGFIDKKEIEDEQLFNKTNDTVIKVIEDETTITEEIKIDDILDEENEVNNDCSQSNIEFEALDENKISKNEGEGQ